MTIGQLIDALTQAIFRQEGNSGGTNPGNLRGAPWYNDPLIANDFWRPPTRAIGIAGAAHLVALHIAEGNSLTQLISIWAPASDGNNTAQYIQNVKQWAGIPDENQPLWNFIEG